MFSNKGFRTHFFYLVLFSAAAISVSAQKDDRKYAVAGTPVIWEQVESERDLYWGPGGEEMKPDVSKVAFIEDAKSGNNTKYRIKDAAGRTWVAKLGSEGQPEIAVVRILYGIGYKTEINYLVPKITIPGKGSFENIRLEARPDDIKRLDEWKWRENPFIGSNELQGLKVMMVFFTNWDLLDLQNKVLQTREDGRVENQYVISDLGATLGKVGNNNLPIFFRLGRKTGDPATWNEAGFIRDLKDGRLVFDFKGKGRDLMNDITVEQGRWLAEQLKRLTERQITDAFRAAGYSPDEVDLLKVGFTARVAELDRATRLVTASN